MIEYPTDTSKWALAIHRVSGTSAEVWAGTLFPTMVKPKRARVRLMRGDQVIRTRRISRQDWKRPFRKTNQRFFTVLNFTRLTPDTDYRVEFHRYVEPTGNVVESGWQHLRSGQFRTLPERVPGSNQKPFTIGLGSCFYDHRDGGQAAGSYQALYERGSDDVKPDVTFLTGDQVYLDIGFDSLSIDPDEIRQRIADDYAQHWRSLGGILNRGGTWMLPDDHEYWNDYPFYDSLIPQLLALKLRHVRSAWADASKDAVKNILRAPLVESFSLGKDLSICHADLRSHRSNSGFLPKPQFERLTDWAASLQNPGVLVTPQPLIVEENKMERNLLSFRKQYTELLEAMGSSGHDILLLSGDVHFGRIARCEIGNKGGRLIEIVSSPLSNLTYLDGIATSTPKHLPEQFPHESVKLEDWGPRKVQYSSTYNVSTKPGWLFSAYPKARTTEHFMTVAFRRKVGGGIRVAARAWRVRERRNPRNLPAPDFKRPFIVDIR